MGTDVDPETVGTAARTFTTATHDRISPV